MTTGSLNPCFSGNRFGSTLTKALKGICIPSLNPCFSGNRFGSMLYNIEYWHCDGTVLILVLVEIGLGG